MADETHWLECTYNASPEELWDLWLHDAEWTQRLLMGRENELDNLAKAIDRMRAT